jgi:3-oxoacyl-[acyl-carrier-protein] synthase-1
MKRVVITGLGIVSCLGNDRASVTTSLRELRSGIKFMPEYKELGFRSQVGGMPDIDLDARIDRKQRRFQGDAAAFAHIAMEDALADAGLTAEASSIRASA